MDVSVLDFLLGGLADIDNFDIECEVDPGEGVVGVNNNGIALDFLDFGNAGAVGGLRLEAHTGFQVGIFGELASLGLGDELGIVLPVAIGGGYFGGKFVPAFLALEFFFEAGNDIAMTVKVGEGIASLAGIEHLSFRRSEGVMHGDDAV